MRPGARTPEELDLLLEDAFVLRDSAALAQLFEASAVLVVGGTSSEARGREEITAVAARVWNMSHCYISDPARIIQCDDIAFVTGPSSISVARRRIDGSWHFAIVLWSFADAQT